MKRRRARSNPPTTEQWFLIAGGAVGLGVIGWLIFRKPAATGTNQQIDAFKAPTPQQQAAALQPTDPAVVKSINDAFAAASAAGQAANAAADRALNPAGVPAGQTFSFGHLDPATTYNPNGKDLGDPNDPNSAAYACIFAHDNALRLTNPLNGELAMRHAATAVCGKAGGVSSASPSWPFPQ